MFFLFYLALGASVFSAIEAPIEKAELQELFKKRQDFLRKYPCLDGKLPIRGKRKITCIDSFHLPILSTSVVGTLFKFWPTSFLSRKKASVSTTLSKYQIQSISVIWNVPLWSVHFFARKYITLFIELATCHNIFEYLWVVVERFCKTSTDLVFLLSAKERKKPF